jgi:hypothetical protein
MGPETSRPSNGREAPNLFPGPSHGGKDIPPAQRAGGRSRRAAAAHGTSDARRFLLGERSLSWTRLLVRFISLVQQVAIFLAARHPAQRAGGRLVFLDLIRSVLLLGCFYVKV